MNKFLFSHSTWMVETIDEMVKETKRKKKTKGEGPVSANGDGDEQGGTNIVSGQSASTSDNLADALAAALAPAASPGPDGEISMMDADASTSDDLVDALAAALAPAAGPGPDGEISMVEADAIEAGPLASDRAEASTVALLHNREKQDDAHPIFATAELTNLEQQINANVALHNFGNLDTHIHSCATCNLRLLSFAMPVHNHESHKVHAEQEVENDDA